MWQALLKMSPRTRNKEGPNLTIIDRLNLWVSCSQILPARIAIFPAPSISADFPVSLVTVYNLDKDEISDDNEHLESSSPFTKRFHIYFLKACAIFVLSLQKLSLGVKYFEVKWL